MKSLVFTRGNQIEDYYLRWKRKRKRGERGREREGVFCSLTIHYVYCTRTLNTVHTFDNVDWVLMKKLRMRMKMVKIMMKTRMMKVTLMMMMMMRMMAIMKMMLIIMMALIVLMMMMMILMAVGKLVSSKNG